MAHPLKPIDKLGCWIGTNVGPAWQMRLGVLMFITGLSFFIYMPFSGEQWGIFAMSALALIYSGPPVIATAILALSEDDDASIEDLAP